MSVRPGNIALAMTYFASHTLEIGILGLEDKPVAGLSGGTEREYTVLEYGTVHEFGSRDGKIPPRPFFRNAINQNKEAINSYTQTLVNEVLQGRLDGRPALMRLGEFIRGLVIQSIASAGSWASPLSDKYKQHKDKKYPNRTGQMLIKDGFLIKSIRYTIKKNNNPVFISDWAEIGG